MRKLAILLILISSTAHAEYVNGYVRSNGTYVSPYVRSAPDGNPYNNYGSPYNPNSR